jgi:gliding motility-associated protein GldM
MGHGKETPRQKMIGMMYLVLLALLALNVSNEVLNAFAVLDEGLHSTKLTLEQTNSLVMTNFVREYNTNPQKTKYWYDLALEVHERADSIVKFIEDHKFKMVVDAKEDTAEVLAHGIINLEKIKKRSDTEVPAVLMIGDDNKEAGTRLKNNINEYREWILRSVLGDKVNKKIVESIEASLATPERIDHKSKEPTDWSRAHFEGLPLSGVLAIMTGIQINVRNAEAEALKYLYNKIDEGTFKFTNLDATVIPNSSYIIKGNEYKAEVFLSAFDTTAQPVIHVTESKNPYDSMLVNGVMMFRKRRDLKYTTIKANKFGKAVYSFKSSSIGSRYWGGIIEVIGPAGDTIARPFKKSFMIAEGSVVVSPTKMNVFYVGVDNPIEVSVAGVPPEDVDIKITNGKARSTRRRGSYIVNPRRPGNSFITVYAKIDGERKMMGRQEFRVKRVPDPVATVNGIKGGGITKSLLLAQVGVAAEMENFDFDLTFRVTEFTVSTTIGGFLREETSKNYKFTNAQKQIIRSLSKGNRVYVQDIKAIGPDGQERSLPAVALLLTN